MSKNPQNHPPEVPLRKTAPPLKEFRRGLFLACLVLAPGILPVPAGLRVLHVVICLPAFVRYETRENEDRLDA